MKSKLKKHLADLCYFISPKLYVSLTYFYHRGHFPNLLNPKNLSEIILKQILTDEICNYTPYVDKIQVREFIKDWGYEKYLPKIYGIWRSFSEIDFNSLPNKFVLKTNNGCGNHYICNNKNKLDIEKAKENINYALNTKYGLSEKQYHSIDPLIFCEEYIDSHPLPLPLDYKFMCCDGDVKCVLLASDRKTGTKLSTFSLEWEEINLLKTKYKTNKKFEKPRNFHTMIKIAKNIAKKFPQVRVDFYNIDGMIYIGELTFTPQAGIMSYFTNSAIEFLGYK